MVRVDVEHMPALHHLAVRQHAGLTHLLLGFLGLREEPRVERLSVPFGGRQVVESGLGHACRVKGLDGGASGKG